MNIVIDFIKNFIGSSLFFPAIVFGLGIGLITYFILERERKIVNNMLLSGSHTSWWPLVGGGISSKFFDLDQLVTNTKGKKFMLEVYNDLINEVLDEIGVIDCLAFIEREVGPIGALQLKELLVSKTGIPAVIIRPRKRLVKAGIKGINLIPGQRVVILNDVATSGRGIAKAKNILEKFGVEVPAAVVFISRENGEIQKEKLGKTKLKFYTDQQSWEKILEMKETEL
jgi:orotate phosphoribosyltransferase